MNEGGDMWTLDQNHIHKHTETQKKEREKERERERERESERNRVTEKGGGGLCFICPIFFTHFVPLQVWFVLACAETEGREDFLCVILFALPWP